MYEVEFVASAAKEFRSLEDNIRDRIVAANRLSITSNSRSAVLLTSDVTFRSSPECPAFFTLIRTDSSDID